ncbi:hypothetical protein R1flu_012921 [Riccia fluitans]|uniref:Retrotransposon gag domain-containing protein n=1 Tax=Riccia fluitans TaxID=41844 RepID=A0ABD1ZEG8_9MARC
MAAPFTRQPYAKYKGKSEDKDANDFVELFENIATAYDEGNKADKFGIFPGLLQKIARKWYNHNKTALTDWDTLKSTFFKRFRTMDYKHTVLKKLASLRRKKKESLQDYEERFKELLDQIPARVQGQAPYSKEQAMIWFLEGLPDEVEMFCREQRADTLDDAIKAAETYELLGLHHRRGSKHHNMKEPQKHHKHKNTKSKRSKQMGDNSDTPSTSSSSSLSSEDHFFCLCLHLLHPTKMIIDDEEEQEYKR